MLSAYKHDYGQIISTEAEGVSVDRSFLAHINIPAAKAVAADADGILDGTAAPSGEEDPLVVTEFLVQPTWPKNITVTLAATTAGDVAAASVVVAGKNFAGEAITEEFAFSADTPATKTGNKAFAIVDSVTIPVQDGDSVTVDVGWGVKFGIPYKLYADELVILKLFNKAADAATIVNSATAVESNTATMAGTPDGLKDIDLYVIV